MTKKKICTVKVICQKCNKNYETEIMIPDTTRESYLRVTCIHCSHVQKYHNLKSPKEQPSPIPNSSKPVWEMVIEDMKERDDFGRKRYGTPLQVGNGRDFMEDAYQELLDLVVYMRGELEKRRSINNGS